MSFSHVLKKPMKSLCTCILDELMDFAKNYCRLFWNWLVVRQTFELVRVEVAKKLRVNGYHSWGRFPLNDNCEEGSKFIISINNLIGLLTDRLNSKSLKTYPALEEVVLTGNITEAQETLLKKYNLYSESLRIELKQFHHKFSPFLYVCEVRNKLCAMSLLM